MLVTRIEGVPGSDFWTDVGKTEGHKTLPNLDKDAVRGRRIMQANQLMSRVWTDEELKEKGDPW